MKQYQLLLILLLAFLSSKGQQKEFDDKNTRQALKKSAQAMVEHFSKKKFDDYLVYVHPKIIQMLGGKEKMIERLKKQLNEMESDGFIFKSVNVGNPAKIIKAENELQSVVQQTIELKNDEGVLTTKSYLVAISKDDGKTWWFIDSGGKTLEQLKKVFTSLSDDLIIPAQEQPTFSPN